MDVGPWAGPGTGAQELHVVDDQPSPTGYRVTLFSEAPGALTGSLGTVFDRVAGVAVVEFDNVEGKADVSYTAGVQS